MLSVTVCAVGYVPAAGEKVGAADGAVEASTGRLNTWNVLAPVESCTWAMKVSLPATVGVSESTPPLESAPEKLFRLSGCGISSQLTWPIAPVACSV